MLNLYLNINFNMILGLGLDLGFIEVFVLNLIFWPLDILPTLCIVDIHWGKRVEQQLNF